MQALVTAGAFVASADGRVKDVERAELLSFVEGQDLVPTIALREIEDRGSAKVIVDDHHLHFWCAQRSGSPLRTPESSNQSSSFA